MVVKAMRLLSSFIVLPSPSGPTWNVARPERLEHGEDPGDGLVVATDHEDEHPLLGADGPAGQRRLDEVMPGGGQALPELAHAAGLLVDRSTRIGTGRRGAGPGGGHLGDDVRGRQRQQGDVGLRGPPTPRRARPWPR